MSARDLALAPDAPDFLIIGTQRGSSTRLNELLRAHPGVYSPSGEVTCLDDPNFAEMRCRETFARLAREAAPARRWGFKRPDLLAFPEGAARIHACAPNAKLLAALREPIGRTVSSYYHYMKNGVIPLAPLNQGMRRILEGDLDTQYPWAREVIDYSRYATHLRRFLDIFDRSALLVLLDDDLSDDLDRSLRSAYSHVGVNPDFAPADSAQRVNEGVYSMARLRVLRVGSRALYPIHRDRSRVLTRYRTPRRMINRMSWLVDRTLLQPWTHNAPDRLDDDLRRRLTELFEPEITELESILDRPLSSWRR